MDAYEISIYTAVIIAGTLLTVIIVVFAWKIVRSQQRYIQLEEAVYRAEIGALQESNRIAFDLHDALGPRLSFIIMQIEARMEQDPRSREALQEALVQARLVAEGMRNVARNLTSAPGLNKGLEGSIRDFVLECRAVHRAKIETELAVSKEPPTEERIHILRIVQEVVHNSIKHSGAEKITIRLEERPDRLYLLCGDNGRGMKKGKNWNGIGLKSINRRVQILNGRMQCRSDRTGTYYFIEIPTEKWKEQGL